VAFLTLRIGEWFGQTTAPPIWTIPWLPRQIYKRCKAMVSY